VHRVSGEMVAPPAKKSKGPDSITMRIGKVGVAGLFSPVTRINGYPWRLFVAPTHDRLSVSLVCCKGAESELWSCDATLTVKSKHGVNDMHRRFASWDDVREKKVQLLTETNRVQEIEVRVETDVDGESFPPRPPTLSHRAARAAADCCLVVEGRKFHVNKQSLAAQSSFFDVLFNGDFIEKNQSQIEIKDVEPEDFFMLLKLIHGESIGRISGNLAGHLLQLADRFDLTKLIIDRIENEIIASGAPSNEIKLLLSERFGLETLKAKMIATYDRESNLEDLARSRALLYLSPEMIRLMDRKCAALGVE
ncbi:hypothetical protein PFISCL1PPCAC_12214, partial [Pristionchus fissidentatus]